jgi:hypothetical protein
VNVNDGLKVGERDGLAVGDVGDNVGRDVGEIEYSQEHGKFPLTPAPNQDPSYEKM